MVGVKDPESLGDFAKPLPRPDMSSNPPRFLIVGAGSRGQAFASAIDSVSNGVVAAVAEPVDFKRETLGRKHIWGAAAAAAGEGQSFSHWREFVAYEQDRRRRVAAGEQGVPDGVDGAFVCVLDEMHREVVVALAALELHIMCEKPLATNLDDCLAMYHAVRPLRHSRVFSIGHVLRYSQHNLMLRKLLVEDRLIGDINSAVHTEPVGWWHFAHSFVRGNWRNDKTSAPALLTKCCHDVDMLLWLLCSPEKAGQGEPHLPESVSSSGGVQFFKKSRKPAAAGSATNCMKCPLGDSGCKYSAKQIYMGDRIGLGRGNTEWPIDTVVCDIEDYKTHDERMAVMAKTLEEDWDESTPANVVSSRNWYGRCVYETDNNVCDDQFVTITWPETNRPAKRITLHMAAQTKRQCERFSRYYGEHGEIYSDSKTIVFDDFATGETKTFTPLQEDLGHGGGDMGLTRQFVLACDKVKNHGWDAEQSQNEFVGCTLDEVIRSHVMVFAAEEARLGKKVVDWQQYWNDTVGKEVHG
ncbi:oxidoreductase [Tolypocladium capitatum]|uniref:Oxidoreductase n=1 Tax=Tolypocladium capitatum TaxID=45235 RepID=A0A2K3Q720_9HYPO|nr:oxidoreductase [Tolypocladium capitatum]